MHSYSLSAQLGRHCFHPVLTSWLKISPISFIRLCQNYCLLFSHWTDVFLKAHTVAYTVMCALEHTAPGIWWKKKTLCEHLPDEFNADRTYHFHALWHVSSGMSSPHTCKRYLTEIMNGWLFDWEWTETLCINCVWVISHASGHV